MSPIQYSGTTLLGNEGNVSGGGAFVYLLLRQVGIAASAPVLVSFRRRLRSTAGGHLCAGTVLRKRARDRNRGNTY